MGLVACADPGAAPTAEVATLLDDEVVSIAGGRSAPLTFEVPEGTIALALTAEGEPGVTIGLGSWLGGGHELVPEGWLAREPAPFRAARICSTCAVRVAHGDEVFSAQAARVNTPLLPGRHTLSFVAERAPDPTGVEGACGDGRCDLFEETTCGGDCAPSPWGGEVHVTVHATLVDAGHGELPAAGTLPIALYFTGAGDWSEPAPGDPRLAELLDAARDVLSVAHIDLSLVATHSLPSERAQVATSAELAALFAESALEPEALGVFFVSKLRIDGVAGDAVVQAIAGGIPVPLVTGTAKSGIALAVDAGADPRALGRALAHELGHALGLYHLVDVVRGAVLPDPFEDTDDDDRANLMHPTSPGAGLSSDQRRALRSSPWVHAQER